MISLLQEKMFFNKASVLLFITLFSLLFESSGQMVVGSYTGDGTASQAITGLGATPKLLMIIPKAGGAAGGTVQTVITTTSMPVGDVKITTGGDAVGEAFATGYISSLDADGFTVGANSNVNTATYYYVAWNDGDGDLNVGTFTGSTSGQNIAVGFAPVMVWVWADDLNSNDYLKFTLSGIETETRRFSHGDAGWGERIFDGFTATQFTVKASGDAGSGIVDGGTYYYAAFGSSAADAEMGETASIGFGAGPDKVTIGVEPSFIFARHSTTAGNNTYIKTSSMDVNESFIPRHEAGVVDHLQNFAVDGFDVGAGGQLRPQFRYYAKTASATLPVQMVSFIGKKENQSAVLHWITGSEINASHFEVERSGDDGVFSTIGVVRAHGNSFITRKYDYIDEQPLIGNNYYRLRQVDFDGSHDYSKTIIVNLGDKDLLRIHAYPNPTMDKVNLIFRINHSENYTVVFSDATGRILDSKKEYFKEGDFELQYSAASYENGVYYLTIQSQNGQKFYARVVKH